MREPHGVGPNGKRHPGVRERPSVAGQGRTGAVVRRGARPSQAGRSDVGRPFAGPPGAGGLLPPAGSAEPLAAGVPTAPATWPRPGTRRPSRRSAAAPTTAPATSATVTERRSRRRPRAGRSRSDSGRGRLSRGPGGRDWGLGGHPAMCTTRADPPQAAAGHRQPTPRKWLHSIGVYAYGSAYEPPHLLRRVEEEALAALPGGTGPGALTARRRRTGASRERRLQGPRHQRR